MYSINCTDGVVSPHSGDDQRLQNEVGVLNAGHLAGGKYRIR